MTMTKNFQTVVKLCSFYKLPRLCSKSFKLDLSSTWTKNFQLGLERAEEPKIKLPITAGLKEKQGSSRITSTFASLTTLKPLTVQITTNCGKFLKRWEYQTTSLLASWKICMRVKKQQLEPDMGQVTGSK